MEIKKPKEVQNVHVTAEITQTPVDMYESIAEKFEMVGDTIYIIRLDNGLGSIENDVTDSEELVIIDWEINLINRSPGMTDLAIRASTLHVVKGTEITVKNLQKIGLEKDNTV